MTTLIVPRRPVPAPLEVVRAITLYTEMQAAKKELEQQLADVKSMLLSAVIAAGGSVLEFAVLPSAGEWGHVQYTMPHGFDYPWVVALAPYVVWILLAAFTLVILHRSQNLRFWAGSLLFVWCFVVPIADVGNAVFPFLLGRSNDMSAAFGPASAHHVTAAVLMFALVAWAGFPAQFRAYRGMPLSPGAYFALVALVVSGLLVLSVGVNSLSNREHR